MAEQQPPTDIPVLDALIEIRRKQKQIETFRTRAEANRDKVDPEVYHRVIADYAERHAALGREALPLEAEAAHEYRRLRTIRLGIEERYHDARLLRDEIEFRHTVGEIDSDQLAIQLQGPSAVIAECEAELTRSDQQKARFSEAMTEEELTAIDTSSPAPLPPASRAPEPASMPPIVAPWVAEEDEQTMLRYVDVAAEPSALGPDVTSEPDVGAVLPAPAHYEDFDRTVMKSVPADLEPATPAEPELPEAMLVGDGSDGPGLEFRLGPVNNIGRADDNEIRLVRTGVSRHHATVVGDGGGYTLKDLGSQNGTFLNGERVTESPLAHGDRIWVGAVELQFKLLGQDV